MEFLILIFCRDGDDDDFIETNLVIKSNQVRTALYGTESGLLTL